MPHDSIIRKVVIIDCELNTASGGEYSITIQITYSGPGALLQYMQCGVVVLYEVSSPLVEFNYYRNEQNTAASSW